MFTDVKNLKDNNTTYVYDFIEIFKRALKDIWSAHVRDAGKTRSDIPHELLQAVELALNEQTGELQVSELHQLHKKKDDRYELS